MAHLSKYLALVHSTHKTSQLQDKINVCRVALIAKNMLTEKRDKKTIKPTEMNGNGPKHTKKDGNSQRWGRGDGRRS